MPLPSKEAHMKLVLATMNQALSSIHGIAVACSDPEQFRRVFYSLRRSIREQGETRFDVLSCRTSPTNPASEIWIVKESKDAER